MLASFFKPLQPGGWWRSIGYAIWAVGAVLGLSSLVIVLLLVGVAPLFDLTQEILAQPQWTLGLYAAQYFIGLLILLVIPVIFQKKTRSMLKHLFGTMRRPAIKDVGIALIAFVPYFVASIAIQTLIAALVPVFNADQAQDVGFAGLTSQLDLLIAFAALVVLAPLAEELIFRGYLFGNVRQELGFWPAAIITSIVFGAVHGQWNVGLDTFILSLVLCYAREKTGSIWAGVYLHAIKNGLAYFLLFIAPLLGFNLVQ